MKRVAVFPGTFDPFTIGHSSIVERSISLFDEIIIAIGVNDTKKNFFSPEKRIEMIKSLYSGNKQINVLAYEGLTVDFVKKMKANCIIRGVRSVSDFEYEKTIADMNREISGIETLLFFTEPKLTHICSSTVRELLRYGHDISKFIPEGMNITQ